MRSFWLLSLLLPVAAQGAGTSLAITGATVVDGTGKPPRKNAVVLIEGARIKAVGTAGTLEIPPGTREIQAQGKWLIPGLIDAHIHLFQSGGLFTRPDIIDLRSMRSYKKEIQRIRQRLPFTFSRYLCSGITAAVDAGGPFWTFEAGENASSLAPAPALFVAGPLISNFSPPELSGMEDPPILKVSTPEEAREAVKKISGHDPAFIKFWWIRSSGDLESQARLARAAAAAAHERGLRFAVHATELDTAKAAIKAGADILVHSVQDQAVDKDFLKLLVANDVLYVSTLVVEEGYREVLRKNVDLSSIERNCGDPEVIATWSKLPSSRATSFGNTAHASENVKRVHEAGGRVAAGSDAGNIGALHGPSFHRELELLSEAGLSPLEVLHSATVNAAAVAQKDPERGAVEEGKLADLLILGSDPATGVEALKKIEMVIVKGKAYPRENFLPER